MEQHHRPGVNAGDELLKSCIGTGLAVPVPVHISKTPKNSFIAQILRLPQILFTVDSLRRAIIFFHWLSHRLLIGGFHILQFLLKCGGVGNFAHIVVVHGMVADGVPLPCHAAHQIRVLANVGAYQEKSGRGIVLFQRIQNRLRAAVFIPGIKGEINHLLLGVAQIGCIKPLQLIHAGVAHRRHSRLPEAESPGAGLQHITVQHPKACQHRE